VRRSTAPPRLATNETFAMALDIEGLIGDIEADQALVASALRPAAQAGAEVLYSAVLSNVASIGQKTGRLEHSIYQVFSKGRSNDHIAVYDISWNAKKAPHGHLIENGHWQVYKAYVGSDGKWYSNKNEKLPEPKWIGPRSFVRRASSQMPAALDAVEQKFFEVTGL